LFFEKIFGEIDKKFKLDEYAINNNNGLEESQISVRMVKDTNEKGKRKKCCK